MSYIQLVVVDSDIEAGDWNDAANRLVALWKTGDVAPVVRELTARVLRDEGGRAQFTRMLALGGSGMADFVEWAVADLDGDLLRATLRQIAAAGHRFDCANMAARSRNLAANGRATQAAVVWDATCKRPGESDAADLRFTAGGPTDAAGPYQWLVASAPGVSATIDPDSGGATLTYRNTDAIRQPLASRIAMLPPGHHVLRIDEQGDATRERAVMLRVVCSGSDPKRRIVQEVALGGGGGAVDIPAVDCAAQSLTLVAKPGSGTIRRIVRD